VPETSSNRSAISIKLRLVTEKHRRRPTDTDTGPQLIVAYRRAGKNHVIDMLLRAIIFYKLL